MHAVKQNGQHTGLIVFANLNVRSGLLRARCLCNLRILHSFASDLSKTVWTAVTILCFKCRLQQIRNTKLSNMNHYGTALMLENTCRGGKIEYEDFLLPSLSLPDGRCWQTNILKNPANCRIFELSRKKHSMWCFLAKMHCRLKKRNYKSCANSRYLQL